MPFLSWARGERKHFNVPRTLQTGKDVTGAPAPVLQSAGCPRGVGRSGISNQNVLPRPTSLATSR